MKIINRSVWKDTYDTLHHLVQMMGKVKLASTPVQPEWANVPLEVYPYGFRTGLLYKNNVNFEILLDLYKSEVSICDNRGNSKYFILKDKTSVSEIYDEFLELLSFLNLSINLHTIPQEMATKTRFEDNTKVITYDHESAKTAFEMILYAYHELNIFISPFRSKKVMPKFYWGTFDLGTTIFSGIPAPFETSDIITRIGFDEQMIEFGYAFDDTIDGFPYFYILIYPINPAEYENAKPEGSGYFSKEKSEFFLPLKPVFEMKNPSEEIQKFLESSFKIICRTEKWPNLEWHTKEIK